MFGTTILHVTCGTSRLRCSSSNRRRLPSIEIPVYFCDSILTPSEFSREGELQLGGNDRHVDTAEGTFIFPGAVIEKDKIELVCGLIEESVTINRGKAEFIDKLRAVIGSGD